MSKVDSVNFIENRRDYDTVLTEISNNPSVAGVILTPAAGKQLQIVGVEVHTAATTGAIRVYFSDNTVAKIYAMSGVSDHVAETYVVGAVDQQLLLTSDLGSEYFLAIKYKQY